MWVSKLRISEKNSHWLITQSFFPNQKWGEFGGKSQGGGTITTGGLVLLQILDLLRQPPKATRSRRFADAVTVLVEEIRIDMMIDVCAIGAHIHRFSSIASKKKADRKKEYWICGKENKKERETNTNKSLRSVGNKKVKGESNNFQRNND